MQEKKYWIKRPTGKRKSFAVVCYTEAGRKRENIKFKDERIVAINAKLKSKEIALEVAATMVEEVVASLRKASAAPSTMIKRALLSAENQRLFDKFWEHKYAERILVDERSARQDFERSLRRIGTVSLYTGTAAELTKALKLNCKSTEQHRRTAARLNEILKYLKREIALVRPGEDYKSISYITKEEALTLAAAAPNKELKLLTLTLFGTGCRLGEALALTPRDYKNGMVSIDKQLTPKGLIKLPKRGKKGEAPVVTDCRKAVSAWTDVPNKGKYRDAIYDFVVQTSAKLWPDHALKHISPHDLRHSYAIHSLESGVTLDLVARSLRNLPEVTIKYYTGYAHTNITLETVKNLI